MNPDVFVRAGCIRALSWALANGAAAAGPKLYWDEERQFLLPPTEQRTAISEVASALAERGEALASWARRRWRKHAHRHWMAHEPIRSYWLSGALFAIRRAALASTGPFDEGFRLYFEEQDWLTRLSARGLLSLYVPAAEAIHLFNQSAAHEASAKTWESDSAKRYRAKHGSAWVSTAIDWLGRRRRGPGWTRPPEIPLSPPTLAIGAMLPGVDGPAWVEISALGRGFPASAAQLPTSAAASWTLPENVLDHMSAGEYFLTVCSSAGKEVFRGSFQCRAMER